MSIQIRSTWNVLLPPSSTFSEIGSRSVLFNNSFPGETPAGEILETIFAFFYKKKPCNTPTRRYR